MKKLYLCIVVLCQSFNFVQSQNTAYYNRINQIFGAIDKSKVTTGLLKEFGVRINEVEAYNGTMSTVN